MRTYSPSGDWKRVGGSLVWVVREDKVPLRIVTLWKRLMKAENDMAHIRNERRRGAEWATKEALEAASNEMTKASDAWRGACRAMGWKGRNGRTLPVHLSPNTTTNMMIWTCAECGATNEAEIDDRHVRCERCKAERDLHDDGEGPWDDEPDVSGQSDADPGL